MYYKFVLPRPLERRQSFLAPSQASCTGLLHAALLLWDCSIKMSLWYISVSTYDIWGRRSCSPALLVHGTNTLDAVLHVYLFTNVIFDWSLATSSLCIVGHDLFVRI